MMPVIRSSQVASLRWLRSVGRSERTFAGTWLYLSGLEPSLTERLIRSGQVDGPIRTFEATAIIGESTRDAYLDAEAWLVKRHGG